MTTENLALVFGPNILSPQVTDTFYLNIRDTTSVQPCHRVLLWMSHFRLALSASFTSEQMLKTGWRSDTILGTFYHDYSRTERFQT